MHSEAYRKKVVNRISRASGHLNSIKQMVEEDRDCTEILIQLSAVRAEITSLSKVIISEHLDHCISKAVKEGDTESLDDLQEAIEKLI